MKMPKRRLTHGATPLSISQSHRDTLAVMKLQFQEVVPTDVMPRGNPNVQKVIRTSLLRALFPHPLPSYASNSVLLARAILGGLTG